MLREGEINGTGEIVHSIGVAECLDKVADFIQWGKAPVEGESAWKRGKGLALGNKYSMAPTSALATVKVLEDGSIEVRESGDEMGQGCATVMAQIAAEEFKVSVDRVKVMWGDTSNTPYLSRGSTSQRTTFNVGNAVRVACQDAKRQLFDIAAEKLGAPAEELNTEYGKIFVKSDPAKAIPIPALFTAERGLLPGEFGNYVETGAEILGKGIYMTLQAPSDPETAQVPWDVAEKGGRVIGFYGYAALGVEVLVNTESGEVRIERIGAASDVGYPLNPKMCEQQIEGAVGMGVGSALWEEVKLDKGRVLNPDFRDYKTVSPVNMPRLENYGSFIVSAPHRDGPFGAKGTGETQITSVAPAIANAIYNAVGIRIKDLPITSEKLFKALKERQIH
jgi:CO/xanthine dehydrogenase Mo-binding subunit